ncbi:hypothetical protein [Rhodopila sp.]|uniref:hypothetical protein n=1 Tax=Rhodopila sp. TaxID=2480087 RepID=UPI002B75BFB0|nr:hypothetical protein [Rhodopila sp.]HVZ06747.1 hypothetical protein [Rhodopila sp.]
MPIHRGPGGAAEQKDGTCHTLSFRAVAAAVRRFAADLRKQGIRRGGRVWLLCDNGIEFNSAPLPAGLPTKPIAADNGQPLSFMRLHPHGRTLVLVVCLAASVIAAFVLNPLPAGRRP